MMPPQLYLLSRDKRALADKREPPLRHARSGGSDVGLLLPTPVPSFHRRQDDNFLPFGHIYVLLLFCRSWQRRTPPCPPVSKPLRPSRPHYPSTEARAARLAKFKREQTIVEYLNRGVSVAEIAAQVGVGEKRMRAVIREILARRMPHPPEEFVAIQLSRLNEALLVAYSAMSPTNLKAVDQVVKIVRELDRYGGAFAAEWARPEASRAEPGERSPAFGAALFCSAELGLQDHEAAPAEPGRDDRPENPAQHLEKVESAPEFVPLAPRERGERVGPRT